MDCVFIRKEPPFDNDYLHALQILDTLKSKVFVINDTAGIALSNEKLFMLSLPAFTPETLVTENRDEAKKFVKRLGQKIVIKPLDDKGGAGIFSTHPKDENLPSLIESSTAFGTRKIMLQRFISASRWGDKRILILNGEAIGSFTRFPGPGDFRANLHVGGTFHRAGLSAFDKKLVAALAEPLLTRGLYFVGIDVIGNYLTEVNVTSPSGVADIITLEKKHLEKKVADFIEQKIGA